MRLPRISFNSNCSLCSFAVATRYIVQVGNTLLVLSNLILLLICVRELETPYIILVEPIALKSVYDNCSLKRIFEVGEAQYHFFVWSLLPRDKTDRLESPERSENVCNNQSVKNLHLRETSLSVASHLIPST